VALLVSCCGASRATKLEDHRSLHLLSFYADFMFLYSSLASIHPLVFDAIDMYTE
jgi:hypothetical protein